MKIKILIPVYNDWKSVLKLLDNINSSIESLDHEISIIIINDASNHDRPIYEKDLENINSVKILNMKINQGHSRCIATGLKYIFENEEFDFVIPMDGDGEDRPEEIKNFLHYISHNPDKPIVGNRAKRSENIIFKTCYFFHKLITLTFAGQSIKFSNYTCLPKLTVEKMIKEKATWSSFSGSLQKIEKIKINCESIRGIRYFGPSKMTLLSLVIHSFSIISVFKYSVFLRSTFMIIILSFLTKILGSITIIFQILIVLFNLIIFIFLVHVLISLSVNILNLKLNRK